MIYLSPLLISIPFVFKSIFIGTPSTDPVTAGSTFSGVIFSVTSKIGLYSMVNGALYWIIFIPFILLIYRKNKIIALSIFSFLVIDYIQFYSIKQMLWGAGKYQAEYVIPFAIVGFFLFLHSFVKNIYLYTTICILLIVVDIYVFKNIYGFNKSPNDLQDSYSDDFKKPFGGVILSELIYPYREALLAAENAGYGSNVYVYGCVYGILPQVLVGYTVKDVIINHQNCELLKRDQGLNLIKGCNGNDKIKLLLLCDAPSDYQIINYLKSNGWVDWKIFCDKKHKSRIIGLMRKSNL